MSELKKKVIKMIKTLPETVTVDEIIAELHPPSPANLEQEIADVCSEHSQCGFGGFSLSSEEKGWMNPAEFPNESFGAETDHFKLQVDAGLRELDRGAGIAHDRVERRVDKWLLSMP